MFETALLNELDVASRAAVLAGLKREKVAALDRAGAVAVAAACERMIRRLQAVQAVALATLPEPESGTGPPGSEPVDEAVCEVSAAFGMSEASARSRMWEARRLCARLPLTWQALSDGAFSSYQAKQVVDAAELLPDDEQAAEMERRVVPKGSHDLPRRLRRAALAVNPEAARQKAEEKRRRRELRFWRDKVDGTAGVGVQGPSELVAIIEAAIDLTAKVRAPGECRPVASRRFDVLYDWARERLGLAPSVSVRASTAVSGSAPGSTAFEVASPQRGRCGACGRSGPPRLAISVTVSAATLLRLSEEPGELAGYGAIDAETARQLAADGEWRRWLTDPASGKLLDVGTRTYKPNAALARFVRGRDRTCRFPTCNQPAARCDLDHTVAFDPETGGRTEAGNLTTLCRHHHRLKHEAGWRYGTDADGSVVWTAPSSGTYRRAAESLTDKVESGDRPVAPRPATDEGLVFSNDQVDGARGGGVIDDACPF